MQPLKTNKLNILVGTVVEITGRGSEYINLVINKFVARNSDEKAIAEKIKISFLFLKFNIANNANIKGINPK